MPNNNNQEQVPTDQSYTRSIPQEDKEVDPIVKHQLESYVTLLMNIIHGPDSADMVMDILKAGPEGEGAKPDPFSVVPQAAVSINDMALQITSQEGIEVEFGIQLGASAYLLGDLLELGVAAGLWDNLSEEDMAAVYEDTLEVVITRGLKDGSIDPIQLQIDVEPLMTENQRNAGNKFSEMEGVPEEPSQQAMADQHANAKVRSSEARLSKEQAGRAQQRSEEGGGPSPQQALQGGGQ